MKLKALSNYDGDKSTRFGDCILIYDLTSMIVYDCGHGKHAEYVESFLQKNATITSVSIVVSHNDSDHTNGVCSLLEWLSDQGKYKVTVYTHQYLKHSSTILKKVDDGRRNKDSISQLIRSYSCSGSWLHSSSSTFSRCSCRVSPLRCFSMASFQRRSIHSVMST